MEFKPLSPADVPSASLLQPPGWGSIKESLELYTRGRFCHPFAGFQGTEVVVVGNLSVFGPTGWLSHIIVHPDYRGRGLGTAMVTHLMALARSMDLSTLSLIATEDGYPLYKKFEFRQTGTYITMDRQDLESCAAFPKAEDPRLRPIKVDDFPEICGLDTLASGENRRDLLSSFPLDGWVWKDRGLQGFYLPTVREGLVVAATVQAGQGLLALKACRTSVIKFPQENHEALSYLTSCGFAQQKTSRRMTWGPALPSRLEMIWSRVGGNFG